MTDLVSVIIPSYNCSSTITRAIDSVLSQKNVILEVIVVDDGSTDDTIAKLETYSSSITVITIKNSGPATARNTGITASNGNFIAFLDADDEWLPYKLSEQLKIFHDSPNVGMVSSAAEQIDADGNIVVSCARHLQGTLKTLLFYENPIITSSVILRGEILRDYGANFCEKLRLAEDWQLWIRLSAITEIVVLPRIFVRYHIHSSNLTKEFSAEEVYESYIDMYDSLRDDPMLMDYAIANWKKLQNNAMYLLSYHYFGIGNSFIARNIMLKAILLMPSNLFRKSTLWILLGMPRLRNALKKLHNVYIRHQQ